MQGKKTIAVGAVRARVHADHAGNPHRIGLLLVGDDLGLLAQGCDLVRVLPDTLRGELAGTCERSLNQNECRAGQRERAAGPPGEGASGL